MKRRTKLLLFLGVAFLGTMVAAGCSAGDLHNENIKAGYNVVVRYDTNGGTFNNDPTFGITDYYPYTVIEDSKKLIQPGKGRGDLASSTSTLERPGYEFIGWYLEEAPRFDGDTPLDEAGNPCTPEEQGLTFNGLWDFDTRLCREEDFERVEDEKGLVSYEMTLHAAWRPYFTFTIYREGTAEELAAKGEEDTAPEGWITMSRVEIAEKTFELPNWDPQSNKGELDYKKMAEWDGHTLDAMYGDAGKTIVYAQDHMTDIQTPTLEHRGVEDKEHGVAYDIDFPIFTEWREGEWYRIANIKQFERAFSTTACLEIVEDLDCTELSGWAGGALAFSGQIVSAKKTEGKIVPVKISHLSYRQVTNTAGGVFGSLTENAVIRNIAFEDITLEIDKGSSRMIEFGYFGLLAGTIDENCTIEGVTLTGTIEIGAVNPFHVGSDYTATVDPLDRQVIGLVCGNNIDVGIPFDGIVAKAVPVVLHTSPDGMTQQYGYNRRVETEEVGGRKTGRVLVYEQDEVLVESDS